MGHKVKVVGMDPSLRNWGVAQAEVDIDTLEVDVKNLFLVETEGTKDKKVVRKNSDDLARTQALYGGMILGTTGATVAFVEVPVGSQSARAMASYGMCLGVLGGCPVPVVEVTPSEVKLISTGSKVGSKEEVIAWAVDKHPTANWRTRKLKGQTVPTADNEHLADAVAAIYAGITTPQFKQTIALLRSIHQ